MGPYDATSITQAFDNDLGKAVRRFSDSTLDCRPGREHIEYSRDILSILRKLTLVEHLSFSSRSISPVLVQEFALVLRQMRELHSVDLQLMGGGLKSRDVCLCVGSWPHLRRLNVRNFEEGYVTYVSALLVIFRPCLSPSQRLVPAHEAPEPVCFLEVLSLVDGIILAPQLHFLTMSSHASLPYVKLDGITGLSNADLQKWLSEVAPPLKFLDLTNSFPREHHDEEHAVDVTRGGRISINYMLSVDDLGLIRALGCTGFKQVIVNGIMVLGEGQSGSRGTSPEFNKFSVFPHGQQFNWHCISHCVGQIG